MQFVPTITLAIAAYNAEKNIARLLASVLEQEQDNFVIEKIIVHSDQSSDQTVAIAKTFTDSRLTILEAPERGGFGKSVQTIMETAATPIVIILNDDIFISDQQFVGKIVQPFIDQRVGLVTAKPQPLPARTFIERANNSTYQTYEQFRYQLHHGHNQFTCDGKVLALSSEFFRSLQLPEDKRLLGNVDAYLYFACLHAGWRYRHVREAVVWFRSPTKLRDYIRWTKRNSLDQLVLRQQFGALVDQEYKKPFVRYCLAAAWEFLKNPFGALLVFLLGVYIKHSLRHHADATATWQVIQSTKDIL